MRVSTTCGWTLRAASTAGAASRPATWGSRCGGRARRTGGSPGWRTAWVARAAWCPAPPMPWRSATCAIGSALGCGEPACRGACPLHNRIPEWLTLAAKGEMEQAAELMHSTNPLPELCGALCPQERLCEGACARATQGVGAVAIGAVEHAVVEEAQARGWRPALVPAKRSLRSAAAIGAGPAGLAFAEALNRAGWTATVHDREHRIGGMLATGLPPFRFDKEILDRRRRLLEQAGVRFELGSEVGSERFAALLAESDAVFLGLGARKPRDIALPGQ